MSNLFFKRFTKSLKTMAKYPIASLSVLLLINVLALVVLTSVDQTKLKIASAREPFEPNCQTVATSPTWNPFPINNTSPSPLFSSGGTCQGIPLLSFFPIDTREGNPREKTILENQAIALHLYYNNGATPDSGAIINPRTAIQVIKESPTKYRITATLTGDNTENITSNQKGGDLILNVPAGTRLSIVGDSTRHYPKALQRRFEADTTGRSPFDVVRDNPVGTDNSNPIFSSFNGVELGSSQGVLISDTGLEAGFLNFGYFLTTIFADVEASQENNPPQITGQEITIIRGESGSFQPLNPTDPDGDYPVSLNLSQLPEFCSVSGEPDSQGGGQTINCQSNEETPAKTEFVIIPTDSQGLTGEAGIFIINIIEADLNLEKACYVKNTDTKCRDTELEPGDAITYKVTANNTSDVLLRNLTIIDDYDQEKISDIDNISDEGQFVPSEGKIYWNNLADLEGKGSKTVFFDAKIAPTVNAGDTIQNLATADADGIDLVEVEYSFNLPSENQTTVNLVKECAREDGESCSRGLVPGGSVRYNIIFINTGEETALNVQIVDEYDSNRLMNIRDINPEGGLDQNQGTITWQLGDVDPGDSKTFSFRATTRENLTHGAIIDNIAIANGDNISETRDSFDFSIEIPPAPVTPRTGGTIAILLVVLSAGLAGGGYYYYRKHNKKLTNDFAPSRNKESASNSKSVKIKKRKYIKSAKRKK